MKFNKFKKASIWQVVKFKVIWIVKVIWKCVNYPFDRLEEEEKNKRYFENTINFIKFLEKEINRILLGYTK